MKQLFQTALTDIKSTDVEGVGTLRYENEKIYRWVKNEEASTALTVGQLATHVIANGILLTTTVKQPATANLGFIGGVVVATSLTAGYYGWIQIYGPNSSVSVSGGTTGGTDIAAGDYLKGVNSAGHAIRDTTIGGTPAFRRNLVILESVTTTTTPAAALKKAFINCLM